MPDNNSARCCGGKGRYVESCDKSQAVSRYCPSGTFQDAECHNYATCKRCVEHCPLSPAGTYQVLSCPRDRPPLCECKDGYRLSTGARGVATAVGHTARVKNGTCHPAQPQYGQTNLSPRVAVSSAPIEPYIDISNKVQVANEVNVSSTSTDILLAGILTIFFIVALLFGWKYWRFCEGRCGKASSGYSSSRSSSDVNSDGTQQTVIDQPPPVSPDSSESSSGGGDGDMLKPHTSANIERINRQFAQLSHTDQEDCVFDFASTLREQLGANHYSFCNHLVKLTLTGEESKLEMIDAMLDEALYKSGGGGRGNDVSRFVTEVLTQCRQRSYTHQGYVTNVFNALACAHCWQCFSSCEKHVSSRYAYYHIPDGSTCV